MEQAYRTVFYFMNEKVSIVEIELLNLPSGAAKSERYHWIFIDHFAKSPKKLEFVSMADENINGNKISVRTFKDSELRFDQSVARFIEGEETHLVLNEKVGKMTSGLKKILSDYVERLAQ